MNARLREPHSRLWMLAGLLALAFAAVRVLGTLGPNRLRWVLPLGFVLMAVLPWLLLRGPARREMGLRRANASSIYLVALVAGGLAAGFCFALGVILFGHGADNWFVSVANSYRRVMDTTGWDLLRLHLVFTLPALVFSPIGEEIFFRGYLQLALEQRFGTRVATTIECAAFGLVHLCHHGVFITAAGVGLRPLSGAIWVLLMFGAALLFAWLRKRSGSLLPAMLSHAAFNLVMNLTIFGYLWRAGPIPL